jgi:hypothetical protein
MGVEAPSPHPMARASRPRAPRPWSEIDRVAAHRPPRDECIEVVGCLRAAAVWIAILASAELRTLGRIDAPQPNARAVNFQRVAIDHTGLSDHVVGQRAV